MSSRRYSVYEAKAKLSELLRLVKSGQEITVTERNLPIAKVIPIPQGTPDLQTRLTALKASGHIRKRILENRGVSQSSTPKVRQGALSRFLKSRDDE